jgi:peptidoglycan/LPS O-acetylase OafA/YrhL
VEPRTSVVEVRSTPSLQHIPQLDGLRAVAALMVLCLHFFGNWTSPSWVPKLAGIGQTGVDLFFVLSGFLITRILLHVRESTNYYAAFYTRRLLRIFPLYYAFLVIHFFVRPWFAGIPIASWGSQVWAWLYLQNVPMTFAHLPDAGPAHFWSLAVEEHFYLTWPFLVRKLSLRQFSYAIAATIVIPLLLRVIFLSQEIGSYYLTVTRMDSIAYGAILAVVASSSRAKRLVPLWRLALPVLGVSLVASYGFLVGSRAAWLQVLKPSLIPAFFLAFMAFVLHDPKAAGLARVLASPLLRSIGRISYGLYVFHPLVFDAVSSLLGARSEWLRFIAGFGLSFVVAALSYRYFEAPIMRWKERARYV